MNISTTFSRVAVVAILMVSVTNMPGERKNTIEYRKFFAQYSRPIGTVHGSLFTHIVLKNKELSKKVSRVIDLNNAAIAEKSLWGAIGYACSEKNKNELMWDGLEKSVRLDTEKSSLGSVEFLT